MESVLRHRGANSHSKQQTPPGDGATGTSSFMALPTEIHLAISQHLIYPDALSLKHVNRYFYSFVDTGTKLKVDWLISRRMLHLECPAKRCDMRSDIRFCRGSVPLLMKRRREHIECESRPGLGCLVYGTKRCTNKAKMTWWRRVLGTKFTVELWWLVLTMVPVVCCWVWILEFLRT